MIEAVCKNKGQVIDESKLSKKAINTVQKLDYIICDDKVTIQKIAYNLSVDEN